MSMRLVEEIRQDYGPTEYLAVVELTTGRRTPGHRSHLHLLVQYRRGLVSEQTRVKNRLHYLLLQAWPGWEGFFAEPFDCKTALAFWELYPSAGCIQGVTVEALTAFLREQSHYALGRARAERILAGDPAARPEEPYQEERDAVVRQSIHQLRHAAGPVGRGAGASGAPGGGDGIPADRHPRD